MALASQIQGEEYYRIAIGQGMYTSELPTNIPDGFSPVCYNMVATGDSLENRIGMRRSSVDWKVEADAPNTVQWETDALYNFFPLDPWGLNSARIAFGWASSGWTVPSETPLPPTLNLVRAAGTAGTGDGFMSVAFPAGQLCLGMCWYDDTVYFSLTGQGIQKITSVNWATDTLSYSSIPSSAGGYIYGLFTFKDRLWGWMNNKLYFTDLPATAGAKPETWALASNFIVFEGVAGSNWIQNVIPLGNRLAVFTSNGLFTLLVEGAPASWILRVLDSKCVCTSPRCAFESKGIIYFVNTQGVWATNTLTVTKLSAVIEDQWYLAKGSRTHSICSYEDGMVVSVAKQSTPEPRVFDKENCRVFYSKLDPIGWTEWNVNRNQLGTGAYNLAMIWSMTDKIPTYLNPDPTVYVMAAFADSTEADPTKWAVWNFLIMDGGEDQYVGRENIVITQPVGIYLKTKHFDGGNAYNIKHAKKGMIELFSSDATHEISTSWDIDSTISVATEVRTNNLEDFVVGRGSNLIQIQNDFYYRRATLNIRALLQSANSQIKIKDVAIAQDTGRAEFEQVR